MRHLRFILLGGSIGSLLVAQACGGDVGNVDGGPDGAPNDATLDVAQQNDSGSDVNNTNDTGPGDTGTDTGTDASDGGTTPDSGNLGITSWGCGTATVSDCSACIGHDEPCVYCDNADASAHAGVCVQPGTGCGNSAPNNSGLCACPHDAGSCPAAYQVCLAFGPQGVCDTCGAVMQTNGLKCENGGTCNANDGGCP